MTAMQALPTFGYPARAVAPAEPDLGFDSYEPARGSRFLDMTSDVDADYTPRHIGQPLATFPDPASYAARRVAPGLPLSAPPPNHVPRRLGRKVDPARLMV